MGGERDVGSGAEGIDRRIGVCRMVGLGSAQVLQQIFNKLVEIVCVGALSRLVKFQLNSMGIFMRWRFRRARIVGPER